MAGARRRQTVGGFPVGSWGPLGASATDINLDLAAQEGSSDTLVGTAAVLVQLSLAAEDGADTCSGEVTVLVQAALAAEDGPDAFTGDVIGTAVANLTLETQEGQEQAELIAALQAQVAILQAQLAAAGSGGGGGGGDGEDYYSYIAVDDDAERAMIEANNRMILSLVGATVSGKLFGGDR